MFAEDEEAEEAKAAGADLVGAEDLIDIILQSKMAIVCGIGFFWF